MNDHQLRIILAALAAKQLPADVEETPAGGLVIRIAPGQLSALQDRVRAGAKGTGIVTPILAVAQRGPTAPRG